MMKLAKVLGLVGLVSVASGCAVSTSYTDEGDVIRINHGFGGLVEDTGIAYNALIATGKRIVIDGHVHSADAFYAFAAPGACYTRNAIFSPHAASYLSVMPDYDLTGQLADMLPEQLGDWFRGHHSFHDWIGFPEVGYDQLVEIWPEGACPENI